jgi:pimeloyl-ACP methyl ester carboxylesterase
MLQIATTLIAAYVAVVALLAIFQRSFIYHPPRAPLDQAALRSAGYQPLDSPGSGVPTLWFVPSRRADGLVVVFLHGNAGNVADSATKVAPLREAGHGILLVEYPGFAQAAGRPTEAALVAAGRAGMAALSARGIPPGRTALWGESLGTGVATQLAVDQRVAGVILEAPFTSVAARAQEIYWWTPAIWLVRDVYDNGARIAHLNAPLLIVHGELDVTTPAAHGRRLLAAAAEPKRGVFIPAAGHVDLVEHGMIAEVLRFLDGLQSGDRR